MELINEIMAWVVAPVAAFVWLMYRTQQNHTTSIAVLKAENAAQNLSHDREIKEIRETVKAIFQKLDGIEQSLRK
tara:strand:- start:363 stop:587 length:225 start_codon:yes stop_codon:yes gene_type:complete